MPFTLSSPTSGRFGPGCFAVFTDSLIGPYSPGHVGDFQLEEQSTGRIIWRTQQPMAHTMFWTVGLHGPPNSFVQRSAVGTADGTTVQIHAFQSISGGSPFDDLVVTGFTYDAVSNATELNYLNFGFLLTNVGLTGGVLAQIRAAVLHTYEN